MDHERFKNIASAVQSLVVAIAVVVGGIWSAYTFGVLHSVEQARAQLATASMPALNISIEAAKVKATQKDKRGLLVRVMVENAGNRYIELDLTKDPLAIHKVTTGLNGHLYSEVSYRPTLYSQLRKDSFDVVQSWGVTPHSSKVFHYYLNVDDAGLYLISFEAPVGELERTFKCRGGVADEELFRRMQRLIPDLELRESKWTATTYVEIE
jgi:hypothetical protein